MSDEIEMPSFEVVYAYAKKTTERVTREKARHLPREQKEDVMQISLIRVWNAYKNFEPSRGWKAFVQKHCFGAVMDYLKGGSFEDGLGAKAGKSDSLKTRVEITMDGDEVMSVENTAGIFGVYSNQTLETDLFSPNWELANRMAGADEDLAIVLKIILGRSQEEIAFEFASALGRPISRERISQRMYEFFARLDSPMYLNNPWTNQLIFALGLSKHYHMAEHCNGIGWKLKCFDQQDPMSFKEARAYYNPTLMDFAPESLKEMVV